MYFYHFLSANTPTPWQLDGTKTTIPPILMVLSAFLGSGSIGSIDAWICFNPRYRKYETEKHLLKCVCFYSTLFSGSMDAVGAVVNRKTARVTNWIRSYTTKRQTFLSLLLLRSSRSRPTSPNKERG